MHEDTYPTFFTPRDEKPSLSSSEEKSLEFDWLEIKIMRKQKYIYEKQSKCSVIYFSSSRRLHDDFLCKGNYKLYIRGYSPFVLT